MVAPLNLNNVVPPVQMYGHSGNPHQHILNHIANVTKEQNMLNNKHGGNVSRRNKKGGNIVVPQAPVTGGIQWSPNTGNHLSTKMSQTLLNSVANAQFDGLAGQSGGGPLLLNRLENMLPKKKRHRRGKTRRRTLKKKKRRGKTHKKK